MTLDDIVGRLFPYGHDIDIGATNLVTGFGKRRRGGSVAVVGIANGEPLDARGALALAEHVLAAVACGDKCPILVLIDTQGQLMSRRDEMLGLHEYLSHLAKCLLLASNQGHRTIGLEYGKAAAGAFLATALATDILVALPGAEPVVMDLPSMARITKLPLERLQALSNSTPVFAPGLDHFAQTGAVSETWDPDKPLDEQFETTLDRASPIDRRDQLGAERKGRVLAASVADRVIAAAVDGSARAAKA